MARISALVAATMLLLAGEAHAADVKVIAAGAVRGLIGQIIDDYSKGARLRQGFGGASRLVRRSPQGEGGRTRAVEDSWPMVRDARPAAALLTTMRMYFSRAAM